MQLHTPTRAQRHESKHVAPNKVRAFEKPVDMVKVRLDLFGVDRCPPNGTGTECHALCLVHHRHKVAGQPNKLGVHPIILRDVPAGKRRGTPRLFIECACGKVVPLGRIQQHTHDEKFGQVTAK